MKLGSLLIQCFSPKPAIEKSMPLPMVPFLTKIPPTFFCQTLAISVERQFFSNLFIPKQLRWKQEGSIFSTCKDVFQNGRLQKPQHLLFKSFAFSTISPQTKIKSIFKPLFCWFLNESWLVILPIIGSLKKDPSM